MLLIVGIFLGTISTYQGISGSYENEFWGFGRTGIQNIVGATEGRRVTGPMSDPNYYAQLILVLVPLAINRLTNEKHWFLKILAGWALVVCSLTVVFTFSRGAVVAAILMGIFVVLVQPPRFSGLVLGALVVAVIMFFMPANYMARIATIPDVLGGTNSVRSEVSFRGRASETIVAWLMFMDNPIFGVGVNNYPIFYQKYSRTLGLDPRVEQRQAHNLYLQVAAETGLAGVIVYGGILWSIFAGLENAWRRLRQARLDDYAGMFFSLEVGLIGYLGAAFFIHAAYPRYFWFLAGVAFAIPQIADRLLVLKPGAADE
jgi:O-antigen ligase